MDKHCALVEGAHAIELEDLLHALFVDSFRSMDNERQIGVALLRTCWPVVAQVQANVPSQSLRRPE